MQFIEYSTSAGPGTLIEHGVMTIIGPTAQANFIDRPATIRGVIVESFVTITPERYHDFIAIHGSEIAV